MVKSNRKLDGSGVLGKVLQVGMLLPLLMTMLLIFSITPAFADGTGYALKLDGTNDYVDCGSDASLDISTGALTIEAWIKPGAHTNSERIVAAPSNFTHKYLLSRGVNVNSITMCYGGGETQVRKQTSADAITEGVWNHVVGIYDGSNVHIYVNGVEKTLEDVVSYAFKGASLWIGGKQDNDRYFDGAVDEVRIWNDVRTETEIRQNMYKELPNPTGEANLVAYYRMSDGSGASLTDNSSHSNTGTLYNSPAWIPSGAFTGPRNCLDFDGSGSDDYVEVSYSGDLNPDRFTVSFWAKVEGGAGSYRSPLTSRSSSKGYMFYASDDNKWEFWTKDGGSTTNKLVGPAVVLDQWTHVVGTYDGSDMKLYINGELAGALSSVTYSKNTTYPLRIGAGNTESSADYFFDGKIEELRIWNDVRTPTEIRENMCQTLVGNESGLMAYYRFDQGAGTALYDLTANDHDGALQNMENSDWATSNAFNTWIGDEGTDWATAGNWSLGAAPNSTSTNMGIPNYAGGNQPTIDGGYTCNHLTILSGVTLTVNSGRTLTVNGNAFSSGTQSGDGKIELTGASASHSVAGTFNNFELDEANGAELDGDVTVDGTLTLTSGAFTVGTHTLTLKNAIAGTATNLSAGDTSSITIAGSGSGVNIPSSVTALNHFTLNNSNGTTLQTSLQMDGTLSLTGGDLDLSGNTLTLGASATLSESAGNTVKGTSGTITTMRTFNAGNLSSGSDVAGLGAHITTNSGLGETTISRGHAEQTGDSGQTSILRYYDVTPTKNSGLDATLVFNYDDSELNGITETNLQLYRSIDSGASWSLRGGTLNTGANTITLSGIGAFSRWTAAASDPLFSRFGNTVSLTGVYSSSVAWGDYDNDGDLDILLTGDTGSSQISRIYRNDGEDRFTNIVSLPGVSKSSVAWGDYDNDGDLDILLTGDAGSEYISHIYRNDGSNTFINVKSLTGVYRSSVAWGDYDNDGDLDVLLTGDTGSGKISRIYRNDGQDAFTNTGISLPGIHNSSVAWGDYDNDGDLDILLTGYTGSRISRIYRNDGNSTFTEMTGISLTEVTFSSVAWGDYDNDGDLDFLLTGDAGSERISYIYRNNGSNSFENTGISLTGVSSSSVAWGDYDNDGDLDILLTGYADSGKISRIYRNNGNSTFTEMTGISLPGVQQSSVAWGDYDNDGDLDILLTGSSSSGYIYRNNAVTANTAPSAPGNLSASVSGQDVTLSWGKSTDSETAQNALTYNIRIGASSGGVQTVSPMANVSSGYRSVPALGNTNHNNSWVIKGLNNGTTYYWSVQAVDNAFAGSGFATEGTFSVIGVTTASITNITATSATSGGNVTAEGGSSVTAKGVVWDTSENPTVDSYTGKTTDGGGLGNFTSSITGLTPGQTYYVRAYATNSQGTGYGENKVFSLMMTPPGNALAFDGSDDYVDCGNGSSLNITISITLEAWINAYSWEGNVWEGGIVCKEGDNVGYMIRCGDSGKLNFNLGISGGWHELTSDASDAMSTGQWVHIAATYDGTTQKIYINGDDVKEQSTSGDIGTTSYSLAIGTSPKNADQCFDGKIDEVRIWNTARSQSDIQNTMHKTLDGDENNLMAYYRFDHLSGTVLLDLTTNDHDGTLYNMADEDWVTSTTPFGEVGASVHTQTQTNIGDAGKRLQVTITTGGDGTNYLGIYRTGAGNGKISSGETFPSGVTQRSDILWGVEEYGTVTANLVFDYSNVAGISDPTAIRLLKRTDAAGNWTDATDDYTHDTDNRTFSKTGVQDFCEFSIGDGGDNSLPVELSAFHAEANERSNSITIYWVTESEVENLGFFLERCLHEKEDCQTEPEEAWLEITSYKTDDALTGQGSVTHRTEYSYEDLTVTPGESYDYRLADVSYDGTVTYCDLTLTGIEARPLPTVFKVYPNHPNPFNLITTIRYELPEQAYVNMTIYDFRGRQVRTLVDQQEELGYKSIIWDGTNDRGQAVSTGIYFYQIRAGEYNRTMKIILLK